MSSEEQREKNREAMRRYRAKLKAAGVSQTRQTPEERARAAELQRTRRARAKADGRVLPCDDWFSRNPERHRSNTQKWRAANVEVARAMARSNQAKRRSTPWGTINNRIWTVMHGAVRRNSSRKSKYTEALGYLWSELRAHLEARFSPEMTWENWGDTWEVDHIRPCSSFHYGSLDDPLFRECWALSNLRPLGRFENNSKGTKLV